MAEERPIIRPSDQLLPGGLGKNQLDQQLSQPTSTLPISDQFKIPLEDIPVDGIMNPANMDMINRSVAVNQFFVPSYGSGSPTKAESTVEFDLSDPIASAQRNNIRFDKEESRIKLPTFFSTADTGFDRYFAHPKFAEIGFTPYNPNTENIYNSNSGLSDDMSRMRGEFGELFGSAFMSGYRAIGDFFSGDYTAPDFEGAMAFENAMRVGNSSRGGVGGFTNNFLLNSAYTFGIIGSIAAEELALAMGSAAVSSTGVGAPAGVGAFLAGTARNIYRTTSAIKNQFAIGRMATATYDMLKSFNSLERTRNFWKAVRTGKQPVAKFLLPGTMQSLRYLNSSKVAAQNLGGIAKGTKVLGGFYRDVRAVNLAIAESKMEAGLTYNEQFENAINIKQKKLGRELTTEEMNEVHANASQAAFRTFQWNAPVIALTNQIVLGRALKGFGGRFGRIFDETLTNFGRRIIRTKGVRDAAGKATKDVFEDAGEGFLGLPSLKRMASWTVGGSLKRGAHGALRFTAANLAEGLQEVYQEAVNVGVQDYFSELLEHPSASHQNLFWGGIHEGLKSQATGQGFETFMSGFLMGGLVQGPQKFVFGFAPNQFSRFTRPEEYKQYKEKKEEYITNLVQVYNDNYNEMLGKDGTDFQWNSRKLNFAAIHDAAKEMDSYNYEGDPLGFYDAKDFLKFQHQQMIFDNGGASEYTSALRDYLQLSDEELGALDESGQKKGSQIRADIQESIQKIEKAKKTYDANKMKYQNKYNPNRYKKGTREHLMESIKYRAYEHARFLHMFTSDSFERALERSNKIYTELASDPILNKIAANDIQLLADAPSIQNEISILLQEIEVLKDTKGDKRSEIAKKKRKIKALENYANVLNAPENQTKKGDRFSRNKTNVKKLRKVFLDYVNVLAEEKGDFVNVDNVDSALRKLIDYGELKGRTRAYDKAIQLLADPAALDKLAERIEPIMAVMFKQNKKRFRKLARAKIAQHERTELLKALDKLGILVPPEQAMKFLLYGDVKQLVQFENEEGAVNAENNPELFAKIQEAIITYEKLAEPADVENKEDKDLEDFDQAKTNQEQDFNSAETKDSSLPAINTDLITKEEGVVLNKLYDNYKKSVVADGKVLTEDEWLELDSTKRQYLGITKLMALYKEAASKMQPSGVEDASGNPIGGTPLTFESWFTENRNNKDVRLILLTNSLNASNFIADEKGVAPSTLPPNQKFLKKGKGINILSIKLVDPQGVERTIYRIVDNDLQPVSPALYQRARLNNVDAHNTIQSADKVFNTLNKFIEEDASYNFDGQELGYGDTLIEQETGQKYFVIGTPNNLVDGSKLIVKRLSDGKEIKLSEVGFSENYKKDTRDFKEKISRPEKTKITRIKTGELNSVYPDRTKGSPIYDMLDDPEFNINNITFSVSLNKVRPENPFTISGSSLQANPYIKKMGDKYTVAIKYNGETIGFVANGQYKFEFEGKQLNLNASEESLQFLFDMNKQDIVAQVLAAEHLESTLDKLYEAAGQTSFDVTIDQLKKEKITFSFKGDTFNYDGAPVSLNAISDNTVDGTRLILIRRKIKGEDGKISIIDDYVSDLETGSTEEIELHAKIMDQINNDPNLKKQYLRKGYSAVSRRPNGNLVLIPLDVTSNAPQLQTLLGDIAEKSIDLSTDNVDDKGKLKDPAASKDFNSDIKSKIFITGLPGDKLTLSVNAAGDVLLQGTQDRKSYSVKVEAKEYSEKGFDALLEKFNKQGGKISRKNFVINIPKEASINEIIDSTTTTIQINRPKQNRAVYFNVDSEQLQSDELVKNPQPKDQNTKVDDKVNLGKIEELSKESETVSPTDEIAEQINDAIAERDAIKKKVMKEARESGQNRLLALKNNKEYLDAVEKVDKLKKSLNDNDAYKILPENFNGTETEKVDAFITWMNENLPEFIALGNIDDIGNRLKNNGITAGAFVMALNNLAGGMKINGTVYVGANGFRYHEAFHAVFRMLLTPAEQKQYLAIAEKELRAKLRKEGKIFEVELQKFKNLSPLYKSFSRKRLEQEFFEEYMADEFQKFKTNPKSSQAGGFIKSFFTRLINWIRTALSGFTKSQLNPLFENIDAGKYKSRGIANNMFTESLTQGITLDAFKLLPVKEIAGSRLVTYEYLDPNTATSLVNSFVARMLQLNDGIKSLSEIESQVFGEFTDLYDPTNPRYNGLNDSQYDRLMEIDKALTFGDLATPKIMLAAREVIDTFQLKLDNEAEINEVFENDLGLRSTDQWDKDASMVGGVTALPLKLRLYIATTTVEDSDYFGNQFLIEPVTDDNGNIITEGEKLIVPVDVDAVYNGILKAVKNKTSAYDILSSIYVFGRTNKNTKAFVTRLFNDMGINGEEMIKSGTLPKIVQRSAFVMQVIKSFQNARINYLFIQTDTSTGKNFFYDAATRDAAKTQLGSWQAMFDQKLGIMQSDPKFKGRVQGTLNRAINKLQASRLKIDNSKFDKEAQKLSLDLFEAIGIRLSPEYLKLSMLVVEGNVKTKTKQQQILIDNNRGVRTLTADDLSAIKDIILNPNGKNNIFAEESGASARLTSISIGNQKLDEHVGATVFTNADGNLVYAHQLPTYHTKIVAKLNDDDFIEELLEKFPTNPLLQSEAFRKLSADKKVQLVRLAGFRKGMMSLSEQNEIISDGTKSVAYAKTYGKQSPEEFVTNLVKAYTFYFNTATLENTVSKDKALAPVLIRVLEASNTGDGIPLPVIKAVTGTNKKVTLPKETLDIFVAQIQNDYARIVREIEAPTEDLIVGYNADSSGVSTRDTKKGRAYKLFNTKYLLPADAVKTLEEEAYKGTPFADAAKLAVEGGFYKAVEKSLLDEFNRFYRTVGSAIANDSGFIGTGVQNRDGATTGEKIQIANAQLNLVPGQFKLNLAQIYFNDKINTTAINELILGDEVLTLKDSIDQIKRAKGQNAAIRSIDFPFTDPTVGIYHTLQNIEIYPFVDPTFEKQSGEQMQEQTDGMVYNTAKGFRYSQFGMGNLTESMVDLLDRIDDNESVPSFFINSYAGKKNAANSKKFVYFDGTSYLKMSNVTLFPEFTSLKDENGNYTIPKPNKVALHNLRVKMEAYENANDAVVFSSPTSALKMLKKNVDTADQAFSESGLTKGDLTTLEAQYMGLQMVNPSNKTEITSGTQMRTLLTSEQSITEKVVIDGVSLNVRDLRKMYNDNVSGKINLGYELKKKLITDKNGNVDLFSFLKYAIRNLKASKASSNIIEQFEVDENGQMKYGLNSPHMVEKAEGLFLSYFNEVLKDRQPGMSLALMSDYGIKIYRKVFEVDENGVPTKFEIIRENTLHRTVQTADIDISSDDFTDLQNELKNNDKGVIVVDRLRSDLVDESGLKYSEFIMPAHFQSVHDKFYNTNQPLPDVLQKHFGIRIPSQDKHSAINLRLVDFMPHYMGSTGVFAREILERSGADFDIDKLYTHMKEFYVEDGKFYEYGKNGYKDFITYVKKELNSGKPNVFKDAFLKYSVGVENVKPEDSITEILSLLGLPTTEQAYNTYVKENGEPYAAAYSNKDLDYKYALLGNKTMTEAPAGETAIIAQEAALNRLKDARKYMEEKVPEWAAENSDVNVDINSLLGKFLSYKNNKEGAANIGLAVKPNLVYSLTKEYKKLLPKGLSFTLDKFQTSNFVNTTGTDRTGILFDELITAMVDNAKERMASKLGLNRENLPLVSAAVAIGIPLNEAILLLNSPAVNDGIRYKNEGKSVAITTTEILKDYKGKSKPNIKNRIRQVKAKLQDIASTARIIGTVMNLDKGMGKDFSSVLRIHKNIRDIEGYSSMDQGSSNWSPLRDTYHQTNIDVFEDIRTNILPKIFYRAHPNFVYMYDKIIEDNVSREITFDLNNKINLDKLNDISLDLLSYLLINKYKDKLLLSQSKSVGSLSNELIYENGQGENIIDVVKKLRSMHSKDNYFLNGYLQTIESSDPNSKDGLNKVVSNTFATLSDNQKIKVQNGFAALYGDALTRPDAIKLLHYIMIKDGLQFASGSIMESLSPFVLEHFLDKTQDGVADIETTSRIDFVDGYFKSPKATAYLPTILPINAGKSKKSPADKDSKIIEETYTFSEEKLIELGIPIFAEHIMIGKFLYELESIDDSGLTNFNVYKRIQQIGSVNQNAIGFMFDTPGFTRPTTASIAEKQRKKSGAPMQDQSELLALDKFEFEPDVDIVADEKGFKQEGKQKISNLVKERTEAIEIPLEGKGTINIFYGSPESATNTKVLSNLAKRNFTYQGRSYGSVEHAYQSNKSGQFDQTTYDKYEKIGGFGKKIRGKAVVEGFDNLQLMRNLVVESFAQNPNSAAAAKLKEYSNFTHSTNTIIDKAFLDGIYQAKEQLTTEQADQFDSVEGEVLPETTSKIKALLKSKAGTNEQVLGGFWNSELNESVDNKKKLGYDTYADMLSEFNELNKSLFPLTEEEFIEQLRCKL